MHWSGVIKNYARALEGNTSSNVNVGGARRSHCLRGCVSVFGHKATCVFEPVFLLFDNLMLEFLQKSFMPNSPLPAPSIPDVLMATPSLAP